MRKLGSFGLLSGQADEFFASRAIPRVEGRVADFADYFAMPSAATGKPLPPSIMSDFPAVIDLTGLTVPTGFIIRGDAAGDDAGYTLAPAGDVNGDGFDDIIVGALRGDNGGADAGEAYVIFGKAGGFGTVDLTTLALSAGFIIQGDMEGDRAGRGVSSAGDINGDGFDDIVVGAPYGDDGGVSAGEAYVIFGKAAGFSNIDLSLLGTAEGFILQGTEAGDRTGHSVSSAGDVNGDGLDDLIIGAPNADAGVPNNGKSYVIFGKTTPYANINLATLAPADGFIIQGNQENEASGWDVASAGDVNGDGIDDLFIGAPGSGEPGENGGIAYVVFGKTDPFTTIDLSVLGTAEGFRIIGDAAGDFAAFTVAGAGDVNGDGIDDMIMGARGDDAGVDAGEAYVVFGRIGIETIDLATFNPADPDHDPGAGFIIRGDAAQDLAGFDVVGAGDVNGDGFDDVIVGAPLGDNGGNGAGEAYVIFGTAGGFGLIDLTILDVEQGFIIQGDAGGQDTQQGDLAGAGVASAGDINNDGFDDLLIGAPGGDDGGTNAGEAYVIFGRAPGEAVNRIGSAGGQTIRGGAFDDTLSGRAGDDWLDGNGGNDRLIGGADDDRLLGGSGADSLVGSAGGDTLHGGGGIDWADYSSALKVIADLQIPANNDRDAAGDSYVSIENLRGGDLADRLSGDGDANRIEGGVRNDVLSGRGGDDTLVGGQGFDQLAGQAGLDSFLLESTNPVDYDRIVGFALDETILLDASAFGLALGALDPDAFVLGSGAQDAEDRLIYLESVGKLFFDPDGAGGESRVLIAIIENRPELGAENFTVI